MGGGGSFYDRDVSDRRYRSSTSGVSAQTERTLTQKRIDPDLLPLNRTLACTAKHPLVYAFDVTGSMGNLPKIIYDKWPGIVGQIVARGYLSDPMMSLVAMGDIRSDSSPIQVADFSALRNLDRYFKKIHFEGGGGGQGSESYEMIAYYYAYCCKLLNAVNPIMLFTGDEAFCRNLYKEDLCEHFGGTHESTTAQQVFADLRKKFKNNVFLIHRHYQGDDDRTIVREWQDVLGEDRVVLLPQGTEGDLAIGDITLGVYAIVSGARTLVEYLEDMRTRPLDLGQDVKYEPQSKERVRQVEQALQPLKEFKPLSRNKEREKGTAKGSRKESGAPQNTSRTEEDESWQL
ncbi:MAG: hypothetical protein KGI50_01605 [Patescibacteria group bacterium]|nr:hypothetical protein [Patescibacteria group bacterium]MDE2437961.1 hypothetical protein [Patescibacteria group bacterium]